MRQRRKTKEAREPTHHSQPCTERDITGPPLGGKTMTKNANATISHTKAATVKNAVSHHLTDTGQHTNLLILTKSIALCVEVLGAPSASAKTKSGRSERKPPAPSKPSKASKMTLVT